MKKHKPQTSNQTSASNSTAEVFVLTPELLAKLGITLSNSQNSEEVIPTTSLVQDTAQSIDHSIPNCLPENEDASSIIQTANLMKESVFLSPTFFQTPTTGSDNEEPIVINESGVNTNTTNTSVCEVNESYATVTELNLNGKQSAPQLLNNSILINPNNVIAMENVTINLEEYESVKEYQVENHDGNLVLTDVQNTENDTISNEKLDAANTVDEHTDEAYLSDCSNSYSGCSPESVNSEANKQNMAHKNKSKEIYKVIATDQSQIKNIENMDVICSTGEALLTPVDINSIVTLHEDYSDIAITEKQPTAISILPIIDEPATHASISESLQNMPLDNNISNMHNKQQEIELTEINQKASVLDESLKDTKESNNLSPILLNSEEPSQENEKNKLKIDKQNIEELSQENVELVSIVEVNADVIRLNNSDKKTFENTVDHKNNNKTTNDDNKERKENVTENLIDPQDKVKEIAAYLSQIANERKNINRNNNRSKEKEKRGDPIKSKLCFQGVEKPGGKPAIKGKLRCAPVSKTYQRAIIRKQIPKQIETSDVTTSDLFQITDNNHDTLNGTKVRALTQENEFCLCYDFGNLTYYDCEMLDEHIHFWPHKNIEYDFETLYSIYHEDHIIIKQSVDFIEDDHQNEHDSNSTEAKLCWNKIYTLKNKDECDLVTSESSLFAEADSSNGQKTITNAIREKSVVIDQVQESKVKGGICNQIASEKELDALKEKKHNSVTLETNRKLKINFATTLERSTSAKCTQKHRKKSINPESYSSKTENTIESNETKNVSGSSTKNMSLLEVIPKLSKKSIDAVVKNSANSKKKTTKLENVISSTSAETPVKLKNQCNSIEVDQIAPSSPTKKALSKAVSKTVNLHIITTNKRGRSKKEPSAADVSLNTMNDANNETMKTIVGNLKAQNVSLKSIEKSTKTRKSDNNAKEFFNKGGPLNVYKAVDVKTYSKSALKSLDMATETASCLAISTNNMRRETDARTPKPTKRLSNAVMDHPPAKQLKPTESAIIIEAIDDDVSKKYPVTKEKAACPEHVKIKQEVRFAEPCTTPECKVVPSKVYKINSTSQDKTIEITITNPALLNKSVAMTIEDSSIAYDSMNTTIEESKILNESVITMDNSTFSSDTVMIDSQPTEYYMVLSPVRMSDNMTTCGVCQKSVEETQWMEHISKEHDYIAWRGGETPLDLDDEIELKKHLQAIANQQGGLVCSKCGIVRKFAKAFLRHIHNCNGLKKDDISQEPEEQYVPLLDPKTRKSREKPAAPPYTCGVCNATVEQSAWIEHLQLAHKYLAWTTDEEPLNLDNAKEVNDYLKYISKHYGGLICNVCGVRWNYVKKYLNHISKCDPSNLSRINSRIQNKKPIPVLPPIVTCGVCKLDVEGKHWIKHIQVAHEYIAWIGGEQPLDPNDPDQMKEHLDRILHATGELVCMKCGEIRKFTHGYLQHIGACAKSGFYIKIDDSLEQDKTKYVCGVCRETGKISDWNFHAMSMHYNIAWKVGDIPINLRNPYAVEKYLKQYRKKHGLVCLHCRDTRNSCYGFYAHILTCGRTEEEIEAVHDVCEVCRNKYLCIYRNQHMAAHRDSEMRRVKREQEAQRAVEEASNPPPPALGPPGKRRAAEKAKKVISRHSKNMVDGMPVCGCGATFNNAEEFDQHSCAQKLTKDDDDSDVSVKMENDSESGEESMDSGLSDEEDERAVRKKKRVRIGEGSTKLQRMPYRVRNYPAYLSEAYKDFVRLHFKTERLFNDWRDSEYQVVPAESRAKYLPQVTESCKVRFSDDSSDEWITYMRFEAKKITKGCSLFTGGATQCIAWAPPNPDDDTLRSYLAVSPHRGPDVPRHTAADRPAHPAALQIWDFGNFDMLPRCALCLAHEYGVVWAMDWCPSGARDAGSVIVPHEYTEEAAARLGLLAIACSNGATYILAVPSPPKDQQHEPLMYKLKPVAELKLTMSSERPIYQATSIKWSQQKEHSTIIVGYSDGTTALYDLNTESPLLTAKENGVTIFYPYQDRRSECSSITGVGIIPTANESYPLGGQFSTSMTGCTLVGARAGPAARAHLAVSGATPAAHWPAVTLAGDVPFMRSVSELEWWGGGRRVGAGRAWAACARCGRAASAAPPALRAHRHHPAYPDIKKLIVALLLMVPLGQKRKRKVNDDLSVVVEPLTYEDATARYGLQLTYVTKSNRSEQTQAQQVCNNNEFSPERFPLSDIVALAFCPSAKFHDRIALATHTGIIFVIHM